MFYLKKIIAIIENRVYQEEINTLARKLQEQGIIFHCFWMDEGGLALVKPEHLAGKDCLWMTDVSELNNVLWEENHPVLAFLHEKNCNQDFSNVIYACEKPWELDAVYMDRVYRRYQRIPWDILETDRCLVRETTPEDAEDFYKIYSVPSITRYTEGLFPQIEQEKQYINDYIDKIYSFYDFGVWTILKKDTEEIIGRAGFSYREGFEEPEIGYVIGEPWQRQGYAEEVCRAILEYGRQELEFTRVQAFIRPENKASLALCHKLGMKPAREVIIAGQRHLAFMLDLRYK